MVRLFSLPMLLSMIFAGWVLLGHQDERIPRICRPVVWLGQSIASIAEHTTSNPQVPTKILVETNQARFVCERTVWDIFYSSNGTY